MEYDKLVRDRIPELIGMTGERAEVEVLDDIGYADYLNAKLTEELTEYLETGEVTELADLVEVVSAIAAQHGMNWDDFERLRAAKREDRGAFMKRLLLVRTYTAHRD